MHTNNVSFQTKSPRNLSIISTTRVPTDELPAWRIAFPASLCKALCSTRLYPPLCFSWQTVLAFFSLLYSFVRLRVWKNFPVFSYPGSRETVQNLFISPFVFRLTNVSFRYCIPMSSALAISSLAFLVLLLCTCRCVRSTSSLQELHLVPRIAKTAWLIITKRQFSCSLVLSSEFFVCGIRTGLAVLQNHAFFVA